MKIFKNKVGRPSNATIRNRRILCSSIIVVIVIFIGLIVINKDKIFNLKGAASKPEITISYDCDTKSNRDNCTVSYKVTNVNDSKATVEIRKGFGKLIKGQINKKQTFTVPLTDRIFQVVVKTNGQPYSKEVALKQNGFWGKTYYYDQSDPKYFGVTYCGRRSTGSAAGETIHPECNSRKNNTICTSGCGGTSIAMALSTLTQNGSKYTPETISKKGAELEDGKNVAKGKYCGQGAMGTTGEGIKAIIKSYGDFDVVAYSNDPKEDSKVYNIKKTNVIISEMKKALDLGAQVIVNADSEGCFTSRAHYMLVTGLKNENEVYLYDPNGGHEHTVYGSGKGCYNLSGLRNGAKNINKLFSAGGITRSGLFNVFIVTNKSDKNSSKPLQIYCKVGNKSSFSVKVNEEIRCETNQKDVKMRVTYEDNLAANYNPVYVTNSYNYIQKIKYTKAGKYEIIAGKKGKEVVKKTITVTPKVTEKPAPNVVLNCSTSFSEINKEFVCQTNDKGVKIAVGGYNSLASGYKSSYTTTSYNKKLKIKYAAKLFSNYKSQIKTDVKGNRYILAYVYASKSGYNKTVRKVKIYESTKAIPLTCPASATVGQAFKCTTNEKGIKLTLGGANSLAAGYSASFTTTDNDKSKDIKYTSLLFTNYKNLIKKDSNGREYINARVTATKTGYKDTKKYVKIYRVSSSSNNNGTPAVTQRPNNNNNNNNTVNTNAKKSISISVPKIFTPDGLFANKKDKTFNVKMISKGQYVKYYTYVVCNTLNECTASNAWDNVKKAYGSSAVTSRKTAITGFTDTLTLRTNSESVTGKTYYLRVATYDKDKAQNMIYKAVYQISVNNNNILSLKLLQNTVLYK